MRCAICYKPIFYNLSFKDIGYYNFICKDCAKIVKEKWVEIPIDHGYLIYYYYFLLDDEYLEALEKKIPKLIIDIINKNKDSIIYLLDNENLKYLKYINFCQNIVAISTVYIDFSDDIDYY